MQVYSKISDIRNSISALKSQGKTVALVPTMGALHKGHLSLVSEAEKHADEVVISIFVNPTQFNNATDLESYPSNLDGDLAKVFATNAKLVFAPNISDIYGDNLEANTIGFKLNNYADILCGANRAGHFEGVCQVITKLFNIINPDVAIFGEKDFQQLYLIKKLATELNYNTKIIGGKTIRDEHGLALSSRNLNLNEEQVKTAQKLNVIMVQALEAFKNSDKGWQQNAQQKLIAEGFDSIDYFEIRNDETLKVEAQYSQNSRIFAAAHIGKVRLIDNLNLS